MANVATRLLSLILLLQSKPQWKASELAEELGVSERTIHRYMGMLEEMGVPIYSERGPYGGFSLLRGYKLPPLIFSAEEATVLYMGANLVEAVWGEVYKEAVTGVTAKLDNVLPDDLRREVAHVQRGWVISELAARDYRPWSKTLETLRECVGARRTVLLDYRSFALEETSREVDPYALTFRWGLWYLIGFCRLRDALRTFRVDRIKDVHPLSRQFTVPDDFSAKQYVDESMQFQNRYTIVVRLSAEVAPIVRERMGHWVDVTDHEDGSVTVRLQTADLNWATGWVLSQGEAAQVLEPPELIERVRRKAEAILAHYVGE